MGGSQMGCHRRVVTGGGSQVGCHSHYFLLTDWIFSGHFDVEKISLEDCVCVQTSSLPPASSNSRSAWAPLFYMVKRAC